MTLQARGFRWSIGIHGLIVLAVVVLQYYAGAENRVAVIDFTLGDHSASSVQQAAPPPRPERQHREKRPMPRPGGESIERNAPSPEAQEPQPSQVSIEGREVPVVAALAAGPGPASAADISRTAGVGEAVGSPAARGSADGGGQKAKATYLREHFTYIRDRIIKSISYPQMARKMGWCGQVKIAFVVCEDGKVDDVRVVDSSGFSVLDRNALDTVKNVAPFPRPPVRAEIRMAIDYQLD